MKICKEKATKKWVSVTGDVGQGRLTYGIKVQRLVRIKQNKSVLNTTIHRPTLTGRSLRWERLDECGAMAGGDSSGGDSLECSVFLSGKKKK